MNSPSPHDPKRDRWSVQHPIYLVVGLLIVATVTAADLWGWGLTRVDEVKNVPRSVRDNPASYRSHYNSSFGSRYPRGK
jgi:hypothetical protein